ncbi:hypothetical protein D1610_14290 [Sphingomonas gilva]|uniref:Uncharacterized protein n=1 Tax=Sphingomonas gilva TaxID=2305907 RepID=A0A396RKR0_9SPHN|nr:hypothetical protein [Sphingomonas gilva]RHW16874.1 hypothetical protein D1610_14290 [Sphingomonas gilva]
MEGTSFGDNVLAALPSAIGNTLGRTLGNAISDAFAGNSRTGKVGGINLDPGGPLVSGDVTPSAAELLGALPPLPYLGEEALPGDIIVTASRRNIPSDAEYAARQAEQDALYMGPERPHEVREYYSMNELDADYAAFKGQQQSWGAMARDEMIEAGFAAKRSELLGKQLMADAAELELVPQVNPLLDTGLSTLAVIRGDATTGDYINVGASLVPGVAKLVTKAAEAAPVVTRVAESRFASLTPAERRVILEGKLEANAMRRLEEMQQATSGAHFVERHGSQLSLASQYDRAALGINPTTGAVERIPSAATRFFSARDQLNTITRAEQIFANTGSTRLAQRPYEFGRVIGEGYNRSLTYGTQMSAQAYLNAQGRAITAFPRYGY